jgi:hypothetical protein
MPSIGLSPRRAGPFRPAKISFVDHLGRDDIVLALKALADELSPSAPPLELLVVGGAALVLLYGARETTKDVDAFSTTPAGATSLRAASHRVAERLSLPADWLNDGAKGYVHGLALGKVLLTTPSLVVRTLAPQQLLAMKLSAWRSIVPHLVPGRELKAQYAFDDLWEARDAS